MLKTNITTTKRKLSNNAIDLNTKSLEFLQLINIIKLKDKEAIRQYYNHLKQSNTLPNKLSTYNMILSVADDEKSLEFINEIITDIINTNLVPGETASLSLIRCYSYANQIDKALSVIHDMKELKYEIKLRNYLPIIDYYYRTKQLHTLIDLLIKIYKEEKIIVQSNDFVKLFHLISIYQNDSSIRVSNYPYNESITSYFKTFRNTLFGIVYEDMQQIDAKVSNKSIDSVIKEGILVESIEQIKENEMLDRFILSNNNKVVTIDPAIFPSNSSVDDIYSVSTNGSLSRCRIVSISRDSCTCPHCKDKLQRFEISDQSKTLVRSIITDIAHANSMLTFHNLQNFSDWLSDREDFTYIVDGANVAYSHQNFNAGKFSYKQIQLVVNKLKEREGRTLVILPACYYQKYVPNSIRKKNRNVVSDEDMQFLLQLQRDNMLYLVPDGSEDDLFWMYATIYEGRSSPSYVITNDMMRDHKVAFIEPLHFNRWRMSHIINFHLSKAIENEIGDTTVEFLEPLKYSNEIQYSSKSGRWHLPCINKRVWLCVDTNI